MAASEPVAREVLPEGGERERDPWTALYEDYYEEVKRYFARRVRCSHDVEDLVQEVFLEVLGHFRNVLHPRSYVRTVARHQLSAYWRQRKRHLLIDDILPDYDDESLIHVGSRLEPDPLERLLHKETAALVGAMVGRLTPALAEAVRLRFLKGLALPEAAAQAGCSTETLKKRLKRARRSFIEWCSYSSQWEEAVRRDDPTVVLPGYFGSDRHRRAPGLLRDAVVPFWPPGRSVAAARGRATA